MLLFLAVSAVLFTADSPGKWTTAGLFEVYRSHSAIGHVGSAKTPALVQPGESDVRVPISPGYELYNAP